MQKFNIAMCPGEISRRYKCRRPLSLEAVIERIHDYKDRVSSKLDPFTDMQVDRSDLDGEFVRQSELAASYGFLYATAEADVNRVDFRCLPLRAQLDRHD